MPRARANRGQTAPRQPSSLEARAAELDRPDTVAGVPGPGRWLVACYLPASLFSLKSSLATSSVGKTLLVPTPYAIKMALVDAAFRAGISDDECASLLRALVNVEVRISPPSQAVVTHTFVKIRQENREDDPLRPYIPNVAYRELVHHRGEWRWAFDLAGGDDDLAEQLVMLTPHIRYVGKRGSIIQFVGIHRQSDLADSFTHPLDGQSPWKVESHIATLDDFGPEATLEVLSSYSSRSARRGQHRRFVDTLVPLGLYNTGPGFSEYRRAET